MKKTLTLLLSLSLAVVSLTGCGTKNNTGTPAPATTAPGTAAAQTPAANTPSPTPTENLTASDSVKTGIAVVTGAIQSKEPGDKDGVALIDTSIIAVTVDKDGKIVKCQIDGVRAPINFSKTGKITTDIKTQFSSKNELGTNYGMKKASSIGKEWNEEATAFAQYATGKTVAQIKGIAVDEKGVPTFDELKTSVTISVTNYVNAIEKAVANAKDLGAKAGDKLGMGVVTTTGKSKDAGKEDGLAQSYSSFAAVTFDASGKITSCYIDGSLTNVNFNSQGKITSDITKFQPSKRELGEKYGMKKASSIGKEWFEEADALGKYVNGKTIDEVKGIAVNEKGVPTDTELASSVTLSIADFMKIIEKASTNAK